VREVAVRRAKFNYQTETWEVGRYTLPWWNGDYIILTPLVMLTRDENWINKALFGLHVELHRYAV
jgi:hypothetical protein